MDRDTTLEREGSLFRLPVEAYIFLFGMFFLLPVAHSSAKLIQMKLSRSFTQSNGCEDIYLNKYQKLYDGDYFEFGMKINNSNMTIISPYLVNGHEPLYFRR